MPVPSSRYLLALLVPIALSAQAGRVERVRHGDTTVVRTTGNGLWGAPRDAIEVRRIGGDTKETTFGGIFSTVALPDGGVLVFDEKGLDGPALRMFDRDGKFVRTVGREGEGPGEYSAFTPFITVASDGTILLRQFQGLINRYRADGKFINSFRFEIGAGGRQDVFFGNGPSVYVRSGWPNGLRNPLMSTIGLPMRHYDTLGVILDSIVAPSYLAVRSQSPNGPHESWIPLADGRILATRTDRLGFLIRSGSGGRNLFLADVVTEGPRYLPEERKEQQAVADFQHEQVGRMYPEGFPAFTVPERKLLSGQLIMAVDGRVWLKRTAVGVKGPARIEAGYSDRTGKSGSISVTYSDLPVFSAFRLDGTYLGDVRFPPNVTGISFVGDNAWAIIKGPDDEPVLVKFHIPNIPADR